MCIFYCWDKSKCKCKCKKALRETFVQKARVKCWWNWYHIITYGFLRALCQKHFRTAKLWRLLTGDCCSEVHLCYKNGDGTLKQCGRYLEVSSGLTVGWFYNFFKLESFFFMGKNQIVKDFEWRNFALDKSCYKMHYVSSKLSK